MERTLWLVQQAHQGDKKAREQAVTENMGLVYNVARRYRGRGAEMEDLVQIGCIGLLKAIDHFDQEYEVKFSTYAVPMIAGEIRRFLRDDGLLKVSRSMKQLAFRTSGIREELLHRKGCEPTLDEIARTAGCSREEIVFAMEASAEVESLQQTVFQNDGSQICLEDRIEEKENQQDRLLDQILLEELIGQLEPEEQQLIRLRYYRELTQTQTAKQLNRTQVQISRMEKKILQKMRTGLQAKWGNP